MNVKVEFVDLDVSESLRDFIEEKLNKLGNKHESVMAADVFIKKAPHNQEKNCECEIRLSAPGPQIFAHENEKNWEMAVSSVVKQLEVQLEKRKGKLNPYS